MRSVEYIAFLFLVVALAWPVGLYLARVFEGQPTFLDGALRPLESLLYRLCGIRSGREMTAGVYTACFLIFSVFSAAGLFLLLLAGVFGIPTDTPIVGDWDGTGVTRVGIYRDSFAFWALDMNGNIAWDTGTDRSGGFGALGDAPIVGKW
jgi:hypothetical protein